MKVLYYMIILRRRCGGLACMPTLGRDLMDRGGYGSFLIMEGSLRCLLTEPRDGWFGAKGLVYLGVLCGGKRETGRDEGQWGLREW